MTPNEAAKQIGTELGQSNPKGAEKLAAALSRDAQRWNAIRAALRGLRAVVIPSGVVFVEKINGRNGPSGAHAVWGEYVAAQVSHPVAMFYDGEYRGEYGRPMDAKEIEEALVSSGFL